jgi:RNA polymerase sigma-70 factor (ECF subfamily)
LTEQTDNEIVRQVLVGNRNAFRVIVDKYKTPIFNLMLRGTNSREDAEELTQEAFMKAFKSLKKFNIQKKFFPWLYTIGLNLVRDWKRKNPHSNTLQLAAIRIDQEQTFDHDFFMTRKEDIIMVQNGMSKLSLDHREALILRFRHNLSFKEIADTFKVSVSASKMRVHRGLKQLKEIICHEN